MRRSYTEIGATAAAAVLSYGAVLLNAPVVVTAPLGIVLFFSLGYVWVKVLFGRNVVSLERVTTATGLALAMPILRGLALHAAGVPLHRMAWTTLLVGLTLAGDTVLLVRERVAQPVPASRPSRIWTRPGRHGLIFAASVVIAAGAVTLASVSAAIQRYPGFTQLWLSERGNTVTASLGVRNEQGGTKQYRLVLLRKGQPGNIWDFTLSNGETWQRAISMSDKSATTADLYLLPDLTHPYRHVATASNQTSRL